MNIFFLSIDTTDCVKQYSDQHVVKMLLETAQLLCTVHRVLNTGNEDVPYKATHMNHPCSVWARDTLGNYLWLVELGKSLAWEYKHRFNRSHKSAEVIRWCELNTPESLSGAFYDPPQVMAPELQKKFATEGYKALYVNKYITGMQNKRTRMRFTQRDVPNFILKAISC